MDGIFMSYSRARSCLVRFRVVAPRKVIVGTRRTLPTVRAPSMYCIPFLMGTLIVAPPSCGQARENGSADITHVFGVGLPHCSPNPRAIGALTHPGWGRGWCQTICVQTLVRIRIGPCLRDAGGKLLGFVGAGVRERESHIDKPKSGIRDCESPIAG